MWKNDGAAMWKQRVEEKQDEIWFYELAKQYNARNFDALEQLANLGTNDSVSRAMQRLLDRIYLGSNAGTAVSAPRKLSDKLMDIEKLKSIFHSPAIPVHLFWLLESLSSLKLATEEPVKQHILGLVRELGELKLLDVDLREETVAFSDSSSQSTHTIFQAMMTNYYDCVNRWIPSYPKLWLVEAMLVAGVNPDTHRNVRNSQYFDAVNVGDSEHKSISTATVADVEPVIFVFAADNQSRNPEYFTILSQLLRYYQAKVKVKEEANFRKLLKGLFQVVFCQSMRNLDSLEQLEQLVDFFINFPHTKNSTDVGDTLESGIKIEDLFEPTMVGELVKTGLLIEGERILPVHFHFRWLLEHGFDPNSKYVPTQYCYDKQPPAHLSTNPVVNSVEFNHCAGRRETSLLEDAILHNACNTAKLLLEFGADHNEQFGKVCRLHHGLGYHKEQAKQEHNYFYHNFSSALDYFVMCRNEHNITPLARCVTQGMAAYKLRKESWRATLVIATTPAYSTATLTTSTEVTMVVPPGSAGSTNSIFIPPLIALALSYIFPH